MKQIILNDDNYTVIRSVKNIEMIQKYHSSTINLVTTSMYGWSTFSIYYNNNGSKIDSDYNMLLKLMKENEVEEGEIPTNPPAPEFVKQGG